MAANTTISNMLPIGTDWDWRAIIVSLVLPILVTYLVTLWNSSITIRKLTDSKRPPSAPYYLPYVGHSIDVFTKPYQLFGDSVKRFGRNGLWKLTLPGQSSYQVSSPENVAKVFRAQGMLMTESHARSLENSFGMPREGALLYERDDSGYGLHSAPESKVQQEERILFHQHNYTLKGLSGNGLTTIASHYQEQLLKEFNELSDSIGDDWVEVPDLAQFFHQKVTKSALISMYGPHLIRLNPNIVQDLWDFFPFVLGLFLGLPRWILPKAHSLRAKLLDGIMRYYNHAHENYNANGPDEDWEEFFGSQFTRKKHMELWERFGAMGARARAAEDLSFFWASNANSVEAATWSLVEIIRDPVLLERVRAEVEEARYAEDNPKASMLFDLEKLCSLPLSQAVYAEVLRLRVSVLILRKAKTDLDFAGWTIKKGERVAAASPTTALDEQLWNTGTGDDPHPIDKFWADRFLVYPDDPSSGPLKNPSSKKTETVEEETSTGPRFSMTDLTNTWIPYSGGVRLCPGRHFAKREIILTATVAITAFDIELKTPEGWSPQPNLAYFGGGTLPIKGKIPCRIRRRRGAVRPSSSG